MNETLSPFSVFHLTGKRPGKNMVDVGQLGLRPALFSAYRDLSTLRYDYPLVLVDDDADGPFVRSLSDIIDGSLKEIAPRGIKGKHVRKHMLGLEGEIRSLASRGSRGPLLQLWDLAETNLLSRTDDEERKSLSESLSRARGILRFDGEVIDCDKEAPAKVLTHAWTVVQEKKARRFKDALDELIQRLSDILKVDTMKSVEAREPEALKRSVGSTYQSAFDFEAMSDILGSAFAVGPLPEKRRRRIHSALAVLESQRFFMPAGARKKKGRRKAPHGFVFDHCARTLDAFQERLPEMVELVKAMTIARLEIEGRYKEKTHDPFFRRFDERYLEPEDLALFPSYLVCFRNGVEAKTGNAKLTELLSSGLPIKVLVQSDDIIEELSVASGGLTFGTKASQLATMALGLNNTFVLQSSGSGLYRLRDSIQRGLTNHGPALFSVFSGLAGDSSGSAKNAPDVAPYLRAAAAMESRALPAFTYDPGQGDDWASRFSVNSNPQAEADWPVHRFCYEDEDLQRVSEDVAFTFADFAAADGRYAESFAGIPRSKWLDGMVPVNEFLDLDAEAAADKVPYILMVDENNVLHRAIVEDKLIGAARRCREMWRRLQELAGINNSHAMKLLAKEKEIWEQEKERELATLKRQPEPEAEVPAPPPDQAPDAEMPAAEEAVAAEAPSDEPYIETPRCTTCDECTDINNRMFAYDDNKQAYIADPNAGTYRQMVEAAESCQVAIIHPGKPINKEEPNLDELMARAEPFN